LNSRWRISIETDARKIGDLSQHEDEIFCDLDDGMYHLHG